MSFEYEIEVKPTHPQAYIDLRQRGWEEVWSFDVYHIGPEGTGRRDIAIPPKGYVPPEGYSRCVYYLAASKALAKHKAEGVAREHAARLKAANDPETYTFKVE